MNWKSILQYHKHQLLALLLFLIGAGLALLGLIQRVPLLVGILGVVILSSALFYYSLGFSSERVYRQYYQDCYEIEHETIEDEIRKSMTNHRYQEAILNRYESACRDLGLSQEQQDWLLSLLLEEKNKVDEQLKAEGGGQI